MENTQENKDQTGGEISLPLKKSRNNKGTPPPLNKPDPEESATSNFPKPTVKGNLDEKNPNAIENLNCKITKEQKREIDQYCLDHDMFINELVLTAFAFYKKHNP